MADFPQLTEEDYQVFTRAMEDLIARSDAGSALLIEKAGHLIHICGRVEYEKVTMATLASNSFNAVQFMASMLGENNFTGMYQQGDTVSTLLLNVDENCLLLIIFPAHYGVGAVRYYAADTTKALAAQMKAAHLRAPSVHFDLTDLNVVDAATLFRKKE